MFGRQARALTLFALLLALLSRTAEAQSDHPFYLHDGDTVVFYGDSITEQHLYTQWVEVYTATRFPHMHVSFFEEGYGGDRVNGGGAGPIDQRLARDVFPLKPTVVTLMLGMNDGSYTPLTPTIEKTYTEGFAHILDSLQRTLPGVRLSLFGPSPYDEVTRPPMFPGGYNGTLTHFSDLDRALAAQHHATFVDLNPSFVAALQKGLAIDPLAIKMLLPDRVHPEPLAHWFMADAILKGWHAPALVSSVTLDAAQHTLIEAQNAQVTELAGDGASLRWTELDGALPLPFDEKNAGFQFLRQLVDLEHDLDQQPLTVRGLKAGTYTLSIDSHPMGNFTSAELAAGVNLAMLPTPMRGQAYTVGWQVRDRDEANFVRLRMYVAETKTGAAAEPGVTDLLKFEQVQQKMIEEAAQPKPHTFALEPAKAAQ